MNKRVALIIDNPTRDLQGICLIALHLAATHGHKVYIVPMNLFDPEIWHIAPDFVLLNYLRKNSTEVARKLLDAGIRLGVLDTEAGVLPNFDEYMMFLCDDKSVRERVARFFTWGSKVRAFLVEQALFSADQVITTGMPRFDPYVPALRNAALAIQQPGDGRFSGDRKMVLINTNFAFVNPLYSQKSEAKFMEECFGFHAAYLEDWRRTDLQAIDAYCALATSLARCFPEVDFVVRPHPFECMDTYQTRLDKRSNLHLIREGHVSSWILRSKAVIQTSCTTAIEANMAGVPTFQPDWIRTYYRIPTTEAVSIKLPDQPSLEKALNQALNDRFEAPAETGRAFQKVIEDWFHCTDGLAHQRVSDGISDVLAADKNAPSQEACFKAVLNIDDRPSPKATVKRAVLRTLGGECYSMLRTLRLRTSALPAWEKSVKRFSAAEVRGIVEQYSLALGYAAPNVRACAREDLVSRYPIARSVIVEQRV